MLHRSLPSALIQASKVYEAENPLAKLTDAQLEDLLKLSDDELAAENMNAADIEAELDARDAGAQQGAAPPASGAPPAAADPVANEPEDDPAPEKDDPVVLQVKVIERGPDGEGEGSVVKTFEFSGTDQAGAVEELKVAARRNKLIRAAMNEVPYKGRNFFLKQNFLDQDPDAPEGPVESTYRNAVPEPGNFWQAIALRMEQDRGDLCEGGASKVEFDLGTYPADLKDYVENLWPDDNEGWWDEVGGPESEEILKKTRKLQRKNAATVMKAVRRLEEWGGTKITVTPQYTYHDEEKWRRLNDDLLDPVDGSVVRLWPKNKSNDDAQFTLFWDDTVEDVLDARDTDFFPAGEETLEQDYFSLVAELKSPGSSRKPGKKLTLYTARPSGDRSQYKNAKKLPSGLFLTSSMSRAEGIAVDLKGAGTRDLWAVVIDSRYLHQTLNAGWVSDYQIVREAPIRSMRLIQSDIG